MSAAGPRCGCAPSEGSAVAELANKATSVGVHQNALLEVRDLRTSFAVEAGKLFAVDGVSFTLDAGRTLCIVGESGCGKSVTALSIMGLIATPPGRVTGEIRFEGIDLTQLSPAGMRELRGDRISMIFQEPMTSLNPAFTVGEQIAEGILRHRPLSRAG